MKFVRSTVSFWVAVACGHLLACAVAQDPVKTARKAWWVKDLAMFSNPRVTVTDEDEKPLGRFSTRALRSLSRARIGISETSGLYSELVIVEGTEPDAFAGFFQSAIGEIPAGTPVIVMSLGLVHLLGRDTDAAAYLIGHETAHLLKGHAGTNQTHAVELRRIRVVTEVGANSSSRPLTESVSFNVSGVVRRYTAAQEQEAHATGLRYATATGYERMGPRRLARILSQVAGGAAVPFLTRHPQDLSGP